MKVVIRLNSQQEQVVKLVLAREPLGARSLPELLARALSDYAARHPEALEPPGAPDAR